jgi:hypothetical protein
MKFKLVIKLVDCVPSKTVMTIQREDVAEAVSHAHALYEANAMIALISVCNANGVPLFVYDPADDTATWPEDL